MGILTHMISRHWRPNLHLLLGTQLLRWPHLDFHLTKKHTTPQHTQRQPTVKGQRASRQLNTPDSPLHSLDPRLPTALDMIKSLDLARLGPRRGHIGQLGCQDRCTQAGSTSPPGHLQSCGKQPNDDKQHIPGKTPPHPHSNRTSTHPPEKPPASPACDMLPCC